MLLRRDRDTARALLANLLMQSGAGDRRAFRQLYSLTQAKLFGICFRICGERAASEDVLTEVYLTIWRQAVGWAPDRSSPITWMAVIARNRAIDWKRAQRNRSTQPLEDASHVVDPAAAPDATLQASQTIRRLHQSLETLEPQQRAAIRSAFFGGQTYAEIAASGNIPLSTVKSRVRRGLRKMREELESTCGRSRDDERLQSVSVETQLVAAE